MLRIRPEQMAAFRDAIRRNSRERLYKLLLAQGINVALDDASGDLILPDNRGFQKRLRFGPDGLLSEIIQPSGSTCRLAHDEEGRPNEIRYADGQVVRLARDDQDRIILIERPGLSKHSLEWDREGRLLAARYPDGRFYRLNYHESGGLASVIDRAGGRTVYERSPEGTLRSITDPLGRQTIYETDALSNLEAVRFPDGTSEHYLYDPVARVAEITLRSGAKVSLEADENERITGIAWPDGTATWIEYGDDGLMSSISNEEDDVYFTHVPGGGLASEDSRHENIEYAYDEDGRLISLTTEDESTVSYEYDEDGQLRVVRDWDGNEVRYTYTPGGAISEIRLGNGVILRQKLAPTGRLGLIEAVAPDGRMIERQEYAYDACDRLIRATTYMGPALTARTDRAFSYDAEDRLLRETDRLTGRPIFEAEYDLKGNQVRWNQERIEYGPMDQPLSVGGRNITYDSNGNMVVLPAGSSYLRCIFGGDGTLREALIGSRRVRYAYDGLGRRISKTDGRETWRYAWAGMRLIWEEWEATPEAETVRRDYLWEPDGVVPIGFREGGRTYWMQSDARGAITRVYDDQGEMVWAADYDAFGEAHVWINRIRQPWRLEGQYYDEETGLHYNLARYYCPWIRSYLSRDPSWYLPEATNYSYARNDPWNRSDPFGCLAWYAPILIGAVIGAVVAFAMGGDPLAGAIGGAIGGAASVLLAPIVTAALAGTWLSVAGGIAAYLGLSFASGFVSSVVQDLVRGNDVCWSCAVEKGKASVLVDTLLSPLKVWVAGANNLVASVGMALTSALAKKRFEEAQMDGNRAPLASPSLPNPKPQPLPVGASVPRPLRGQVLFPATPVTIVRKDPGTEDARRALATAFMKQHTALGGLSQHKLASHLKGIDFRKPVTIKTLPKGTCIVQYVRKNGQPGLYCAYPGTQPRDLAIWARGREVQEWTITKPTRVLESTASKMRHLPGTLIGGPGGDIQLLMPKTWLRHATPVQM